MLALDDYAYFTTTTVTGWEKIFELNPCREIVLDSLRYSQENKGLLIHSWCIMPNHLHMIISSKGKAPWELLRDFKRHTSTHIVSYLKSREESRIQEWLEVFWEAGIADSKSSNHKLWRRGKVGMELYGLRMYTQKANYIHNNPVKAGLVKAPEDYPYSSVFKGEPLLEVTPWL